MVWRSEEGTAGRAASGAPFFALESRILRVARIWQIFPLHQMHHTRPPQWQGQRRQRHVAMQEAACDMETRTKGHDDRLEHSIPWSHFNLRPL